MSLAETSELVAEMNLKGDFPRQAARFQKGLDGLNKRTKELRGGLSKIGQGLAKGFKNAAVIGAGAAGFLAFNIAQGIESLAELEDVTNQTNAVLKSTKGAAGISAKAIRDLAQEYEDLTTIDDKVIQSGENVLLTFTNIRKRAFEPALAAALDLSVAMDQDLKSSVVQVGKALNDPIKGMTALQRVGVSFSEQQRKVIKRLVETGQSAKAQQIILRELNREFGGSAKAAAGGYRGSLNRLKDSVEDLQQSLAAPLIRPLTRVANKMATFAKSKDIQKGIRGIGEAFASLFETPVDTKATSVTDALGKGLAAAVTPSPFEKGLQLVKEGFTTIQGLDWSAIRSGLDQTFQVAAKAVDLFKGLPPELQTALVTLLAANKLTGGLVASGLKDIAGLALSQLRTITAGNVTVIGANVTGPGGVPTTAAGTAGAAGGSLVGSIAKAIAPLAAAGIINEILRQGGPKRPDEYGPLGGLGMSGWDEAQVRATIAEQQRQSSILAQESVTSKAGNAILGNVKGFVAKAQEYAGLTSRVVPRQFEETKQTTAAARLGAERTLKIPQMVNPFLSRIDQSQKQGNAQESERGRTMTMLGRLQANKIAGLVPVLGGVKQAVTGVTSAVNRGTAATQRQDLSVRVSVAATTVVQGVQRVTNQNRFVVD